MSERVAKVTEFVGEHLPGYKSDSGVFLTDENRYIDIDDLIQAGTEASRGRWRITVEFEEEESLRGRVQAVQQQRDPGEAHCAHSREALSSAFNKEY